MEQVRIIPGYSDRTDDELLFSVFGKDSGGSSNEKMEVRWCPDQERRGGEIMIVICRESSPRTRFHNGGKGTDTREEEAGHVWI